MKTHILCSLTFFDNRAVYEVTWKNIQERGRAQTTLRSMRIASWIPKATNTHSEYVIFLAFPVQEWLHERAPMLHYTLVPCIFTSMLEVITSENIPGHRVLNHTVECQKELFGKFLNGK